MKRLKILFLICSLVLVAATGSSMGSAQKVNIGFIQEIGFF
ncbi:hypothetical protein QUF90_03170 [Desulfococcaceae bacterium HSG9]|nr:hypothetical protein [Desulfococcaceae bacterium HSG9]